MSRLRMTSRDNQILAKLSDYGLLSTRQLEAMFFPGVKSTTVLRRLRRLEDRGYLHRNAGHRSFVWTIGERTPFLYELKPYGAINKNTLSHDVAVNDVRWALEKNRLGAAWKAGHVLRREAGWRFAKNPRAFDAVPDGLIGVSAQGSYRGVALEVELNAKARSRYRKVFEAYRCKKNIWKIWYVVAHEKLGRMLLEIASQMLWEEAKDLVVYSVKDEIIKDPRLARVWTSSGMRLVPELIPFAPSPDPGSAPVSRNLPAHSPAHPVSSFKNAVQIEKSANSLLSQQESESRSEALAPCLGLTYRGGLRGREGSESLCEDVEIDAESEVSHGF